MYATLGLNTIRMALTINPGHYQFVVPTEATNILTFQDDVPKGWIELPSEDNVTVSLRDTEFSGRLQTGNGLTIKRGDDYLSFNRYDYLRYGHDQDHKLIQFSGNTIMYDLPLESSVKLRLINQSDNKVGYYLTYTFHATTGSIHYDDVYAMINLVNQSSQSFRPMLSMVRSVSSSSDEQSIATYRIEEPITINNQWQQLVIDHGMAVYTQRYVIRDGQLYHLMVIPGADLYHASQIELYDNNYLMSNDAHFTEGTLYVVIQIVGNIAIVDHSQFLRDEHQMEVDVTVEYPYDITIYYQLPSGNVEGDRTQIERIDGFDCLMLTNSDGSHHGRYNLTMAD